MKVATTISDDYDEDDDDEEDDDNEEDDDDVMHYAEVASSSFYLSWGRVPPYTVANTAKIKRSIEHVYSHAYRVLVKHATVSP